MKRVHLMGIGGSGMSAAAEIAKAYGFKDKFLICIAGTHGKSTTTTIRGDCSYGDNKTCWVT